MKDIKLPQLRLKLGHLLINRRKLVCFDVASCVDIDCGRSSLCQACLLSRESIRTEFGVSWVRVSIETDLIAQIKRLYPNIEYHIYHLILDSILINFKEKGK